MWLSNKKEKRRPTRAETRQPQPFLSLPPSYGRAGGLFEVGLESAVLLVSPDPTKKKAGSWGRNRGVVSHIFLRHLRSRRKKNSWPPVLPKIRVSTGAHFTPSTHPCVPSPYPKLSPFFSLKMKSHPNLFFSS